MWSLILRTMSIKRWCKRLLRPCWQEVGPDVERLVVHLEAAENAVQGWALRVTVPRDDAVLPKHLRIKQPSKLAIWSAFKTFAWLKKSNISSQLLVNPQQPSVRSLRRPLKPRLPPENKLYCQPCVKEWMGRISLL